MPTLVVKRLISPGCEIEYEHNIEKLIKQAEHMDGFMGVTIARPANKNYPLYIFSAKFDNRINLRHFIESEPRKQCLKILQRITLEPIRERTIEKLDWWFALPGETYNIPRYKMVVVSIIAAFPIVFLINLLLNPLQHLLELTLHTLIALTITIISMTYITMPIFLQVFKKWLYIPQKRSKVS